MATPLKSRMFKYGSNAFAAVLVVLGILVMVNFLADRYRRRIDTTEGKIFSLSDQTVTLLDSLKKNVEVVAFFTAQDRPGFERLLQLYAYESGRFSYRFVDPDKEPTEARRFNIKEYNTSVVLAGDKEERIRTTEEKDLTNAIAKAVREREKVIYFLTGHGERSLEDFGKEGYNSVKNALLEVNYVLRDTLLLARDKRVPDDCDLLVVAGPRTRFFEAEVDSIRSYLAGGGAGFFLLDPEVETGLEPMLEAWAIRVNDDYVVDGSGIGRLFGLDYSMPVAVQYANHPVTEKHQGMMTFYKHARSVTRIKENVGPEAYELVKTSTASWAEKDRSSGARPKFDEGRDVRGPVSLAMAVKATPKRTRIWGEDAGMRKTQIVVFGDSDFASNQFFGAQGNGDLFLNGVNWLLEEGDMISIRPKDRGVRRIHLTERDVQWVFWLSLVILPAIPVVAGIAVWRSRR